MTATTMERHDWDILPPEILLAALEELHLRAYGGRRYEAYELMKGGTYPIGKRKANAMGLIRNENAWDDLMELQELLYKLGSRVVAGKDWRELLAPKSVGGKPT